MLNSANMYPWYRDSMSQLGQFCSGNNLPAPTAAHIKTENGYNDCMLALDYAQNKVRKSYFQIMTGFYIVPYIHPGYQIFKKKLNTNVMSKNFLLFLSKISFLQ